MAAMSDIRSSNIDPRVDLIRRNEEAENERTPKRKFITEVRKAAEAPIYSPEGHILMEPECPDSIDKAIWKIIRGLYFVESQDRIVLSEDTDYHIIGPIQLRNQNIAFPSAYSYEDRIVINDLLEALTTRPPQGEYPVLFDHRYNSIPVSEIPNLRRYTWVLILHGSIVIFVTFETQ
jgi:hypothetical protein